MQQLLTDIEHLHYQSFLLSLLEDMKKALPKAKNDGKLAFSEHTNSKCCV